ncbi:hypothetical protein GQ53DRAFT_154060 [Thozetella sp. PMI_491]|nr:hypothetical protein GQ53DRAFT_154060 [Thozetella sp. PMI_491]
MPSLLNTDLVAAPPLASTTDAILSELSRQLASAHSRRLSKGSNGHRTPGSAMKVIKPSSANNSPQSTLLKSRRRTMMNDSLHGRFHLPHPSDPSYLPTPGNEMVYEPVAEPAKRAPRPVSWHPSPQQIGFPQQPQQQLQQQSQPVGQYPFPAYQEVDLYTSFQQLPPTPAAYSGYNSPASATAFSPLSLPYSNLDFPSYVSPAWAAGTAPTNASQSSLEDDEADGEILYGMGLYDTPENPQLDYHRSTVLSLLGPADSADEPTGKGLKLEDAWDPPALDDDDEEKDDDDEGSDDAEGEEQDE